MLYEVAGTSWGPEEIDAVQRVLASGRFTMGDEVRRFEEAFAARFGVKHAVMVNSGSSANLAAVAALFSTGDRPLCRGDEAIVPAIAWSTTFYPLQQYGLRLRFLDVDLDTLNMDASRLEAALTPRTRLVVAVSVRQPCTPRRNPGVLRSPRSLPARGQLRVHGCQPERPALRHLRPRQHLQHVLLPPHLDDGRRAAADR
jgi:hypothetical protein